MKFSTWLENLDDEQQANQFPASAEVMRTGLQPQVDAQEINTTQKEEHDKLLAIDGHVQRIKSVIDGMQTKGSERLKQIKSFMKDFMNDWEDLKNGNPAPSQKSGPGLGEIDPSDEELDYRKDNQPLPNVGNYRTY